MCVVTTCFLSSTFHALASLALGSTVSLDNLGPVILNADGSMSRIANWDKMAPVEQETAWRLITKRNAERRKALEEQQAAAAASAAAGRGSGSGAAGQGPVAADASASAQ